MPLRYSPGRPANAFEAAVIRELGRLECDGYLAHNVLLPNVRDRYNPNEHDIVLLLPQLAYTIDAKEYEPGDYRLNANSSSEWRRSRPEFNKGDEKWKPLRGLPNPFHVAFQKAKILHSLFVRLDRRLQSYRVDSIIVVPDHARVAPDVADESDPRTGVQLNLRVKRLSSLVETIHGDMRANAVGKQVRSTDLGALAKAFGTEPPTGRIAYGLGGLTLHDEIHRVERGCPVEMRAFRGLHDLSGTPVEVRLYRKWPWSPNSDKFLRRLARRLKSLYRVQAKGVPRVILAEEYPDLIVYASNLFPGESIHAVINRRGALAPSLVKSLLGNLAATAGKLHDEGITHLDIRPEHVLVGPNLEQTQGRDHQLVGLTSPLVDGGRISTVTNVVGFDASFVAPELLSPGHDERSGVPADIYSLARLGYYCAFGERRYRERVEANDWKTADVQTAERDPFLSALERASSPFANARPQTIAAFLRELA